MMTCRTASRLHTAAAEGALSGLRHLRYRAHMTVCGPCQRYRAQLETTRSVLSMLPAPPPPPASFVDALAAELDKKEDTKT